MRVKISGVHWVLPHPALMALPAKTGTCSICKKKGSTDWHHIISQHHAIRTGREDLLENPDNVVELCRGCHSQTTASMVRKRLTKKHGPIGKRKRKRRMTPEEKKAARQKRLEERSRPMNESLEKMGARGAATGKKREQGSRMHKFFRRTNWEGIPVESLYPPDHWLHDPEQYDWKMSLEFEVDWIWVAGGGAKHYRDAARMEALRIVKYRPPPKAKPYTPPKPKPSTYSEGAKDRRKKSRR